MAKLIDMTGWIMAEHGVPNSRLTVIKRATDVIKKDGKHETAWWCQCDCGSEPFVALGYNIKNGNTNSCGCYKLDRDFEANHKTNIYDYSREYGVGYAINTGREFYFDWDDFDLIKDYCWYEQINKCGYHSLETRDYKNGNKLIRMHYLFGCKGWDHEDRNALNNRRNNLRPATKHENARNLSLSTRNTSGVIGVGYYKPGNKWRAYIEYEDKFISLGYYFDKTDAIKARLKAEQKYFKEFAPQRHLYEEYGVTQQNDLGGDVY